MPLKARIQRGWWRFMLLRQKLMNGLLTHLYGTPMQVLPAGHVGLAGALVLWMAQDGGRQMVMLRNPKARDSRARLVSFMGLGKHGDVATAMKAAARAQLGELFAKTLKLDKIAIDRIAAAPMFTFTDDENGIVTPVQVLVWVMQIQPVQLELLKLVEGSELMLVSEQVLAQGKATYVAPTHVSLWRSVQRHLPVRALPRDDESGASEERVAEAEKTPAGRLLH